MTKAALFVFAAQIALVTPALANEAEDAEGSAQTARSAPAAPPKEIFSTGVAKGRDRLDSATSTSALRGDEIQNFGQRSLGDVLRAMAGMRVESSIGEGNKRA